MTGPAILLFHGRGILSALVRWQTRSRWSHAALLLPDGKTIIEAWPGKGVQQKTITDWAGVEAFDLDLTEGQWANAIAFARSKIGCGYDYLGVARFLTRRERDNPARWFCSELVFAALDRANAPPLARIKAWAVSPELLAISPCLFPKVG